MVSNAHLWAENCPLVRTKVQGKEIRPLAKN
jgi:hypothetical protein